MRVVSSLVLFLLSGCAAFKSVDNSPSKQAERQNQMADVGRQVAAMQDAQRAAEKKCDELRQREVGWAEERFIGERFASNLLEKNGKAASDEAIKYVAVVGKNLARYSSRPDIAWSFAVIENEAPRSFSAPGGYVFITTGALAKMTNEAQLAGVLGFEIGNVTTKRTLAAYVKARHSQCTTASLARTMLEAGAAPDAVAQAARYAKDFENYDLDKSDEGFTRFILDSTMQLSMFGDVAGDYESDKLALQLVSFAGYDAREYEAFLKSLPQEGNRLEARAEKLKALREGELAPFATGTAKPNLKVVR